jgi:nicotinate-nucleotide adenylyltransferase
MSQQDRDSSPSSAGARVAFFGGSFDPPHMGHLAVARAARTAFRLDRVLFAPVGAQPLKPEGAAASFEDRLAMTKLAIEGEAGFAVSLADAPRTNGEPNFTLETLQDMRAELGHDSALYCLMGADSFFGLRSWHRAAEIPFLASLIIASRPGEALEGLQGALPEGIRLEARQDGTKGESDVEIREFRLVNVEGDCAPLYVLPGLDVEISASEIRSHARDAETVSAAEAVVPALVAEYIRSHGLYR